MLSRSWIRNRVRSRQASDAEVAGLLGDPGAGRAGGAAGELDAAASELDEEEHVVAAKADRLDGEEIARQHGRRLLAEKLAPAWPPASRRGRQSRREQEPADGTGRDADAQPEQFASDARVTPARVLVRKAPDRACSRSASRDFAPSIGSSRTPVREGKEQPMATRATKAKATPAADALTCPECGKTFTRAASLGAHRKMTHGVAGTSKNATGNRTNATASSKRRTTTAAAAAAPRPPRPTAARSRSTVTRSSVLSSRPGSRRAKTSSKRSTTGSTKRNASRAVVSMAAQRWSVDGLRRELAR